MGYSLKITVYNNRDYEQSFTLRDDVGNVYDLTGCKLTFAIGQTQADKPLQSHTTNTTQNKCIHIVDLVNGQVNLTLPYSVLKTLAPGTYIHDLILINAENKRVGIWTGQMLVKRGVANGQS